ncbi:MAG TPA: 2-keto-4-pentenoate hydratase [Stellaceae bacterium]|nr:2-keto-4-pentenoate hydratase [Stellaceae bacterium]
MLVDRAEEAARLLCAARGGKPIAELPAECRPQSDADAYQIQDAVARRLGETIGGWKVGAASPTTAAFCAPIFARMIRPSPAAYTAGELRLIGIEGEIAFRLGRDLPSRAAPYEAAEVTAGATLHPAIEIVDSRYTDFRSLGRASILADNFSNGGLVWGAAVPNWEALDLVRTEMRVTEDVKPLADSAMGVARDPVAALVDFANLTRTRGGAKAGMFVTTGSWTGMVFTRHGTKITADFGPLGRVDIAFAEA